MRLFPAPKIGCNTDFSKHLSPRGSISRFGHLLGLLLARNGTGRCNQYRQTRLELERRLRSRVAADLAEHLPKNKDSGLEKWSREAILVDGCGRSAYRVVGLVVSKTVVFVSNKSKKVKEIQEIQDRPRNPRLSLASRVIN